MKSKICGKLDQINPCVKLDVINILHCKICPRVFISTDKFNAHQEDHKTNKDLVVCLEKVEIFACEQCQAAYLHSNELNKHVASHKNGFNNIDANSHKCEDCGKSFTCLRDLSLHKVTHLKFKSTPTNNNRPAKIKAFKCPECDAAFVANSTLEAHSILHSPFVNICHCGIGYYKKSDLISHKRLVHVETFENYLDRSKKSDFKMDIVYKDTESESDSEPEIKKKGKKRGPKKRQRS